MQLFFWTAAVVCLVLAIHYYKGFKVFAALLGLFLVVLGNRYSTFLPAAVHKYIVKPNEFTREAPFIAKKIQPQWIK